MCSNQPFSSVLNHVITIQNRHEQLITAHVLWTSSNTWSKTRGTQSQTESKEALECHPLESEVLTNVTSHIALQEAVLTKKILATTV